MRDKQSVLSAFKRLLDAAMLVCLVFLLIIVFLGPIKFSVFGLTVKASHLHSVLTKFVVLLFLRLSISLEFRNLLLIVGSVVVSLAFGEIALRLWDAPITHERFVQIHTASPTLAWDLKPGTSGYGALGEHYEINAAGVRDTTNHSSEKKPGTYRIAVVGDSFTFGMGVDNEDTYPEQLERILASEGLSVEVINCGVIAHNMWQHLESLKHKALPYQPDLIVLGLFEDDLNAPARPPGTMVGGYEGTNPFVEQRRNTRLSWSYLRNFLKNMEALYEHKYRGYREPSHYVGSIAKRKKMWGPEDPTNFNYKIMAGKNGPEFYARFSRALGEFARIAEAAGSEVLVVMIPDSVQLNDPHMKVVNRIVSATAREHALPFLDVTPILEAEENLESLYLFPHDAHNSPKGLRLIAEAIAAKIIALQGAEAEREAK